MKPHSKSHAAGNQVIDRRQILFFLGAGAVWVALPTFAQNQARIRRIGFLAVGWRSTPNTPNLTYQAFVDGMRELGYREGGNLSIEWRFAEEKVDRLPALAQELVGNRPEVLVTHGNLACAALLRLTKDIPIVNAVMGDPVQQGFAATLARPGGNVTGLMTMSEALAPKQLELLKQAMPRLNSVGVIRNPANIAHSAIIEQLTGPARNIGVKIVVIPLGTPADTVPAFAKIREEGSQAILVLPDGLISQQGTRMAQLAIAARLPSIAPNFSQSLGFLMSYGPEVNDYYHSAASYVDKILKGAKPGRLPIEGPTRIPLYVNLKTAKAIGFKIPQGLLLQAARVIE